MNTVQKFLIFPNGVYIAKKAWDYLVKTGKADKVAFDKLWKQGRSVNNTLLSISSEIRSALLPLVESVHYDYKTLDKLNCDNHMRIVEAPDDGKAYRVSANDEIGGEYIEEVHKCYYEDPDWLARSKYVLKNMCIAQQKKLQKQLKENGIDKVIAEDKKEEIILAMNSHYAVARVSNRREGESKKYFFLIFAKSVYYKSTQDHPKICYELIKTNHFYSEYELNEIVKLKDAITFHLT